MYKFIYIYNTTHTHTKGERIEFKNNGSEKGDI